MQLSALYSNLEQVFSRIDFNCGDRANVLNVIFAQVHRKKERDGDSHNLGKTTLIALLDFMLLKDIGSTGHFLAKHQDRFIDFNFCLELLLVSGRFLTIRRSVRHPNKISLRQHDEEKSNLLQLPPDEWDHWDIPLQSARELVDSYLDLRVIAPWDFRKGVSYFLRTQEDYRDVFQIAKFMQGKDREWKPYVGAIFGLDHVAIHEKYILDDQIESLMRKRDERKSEVQIDPAGRGDLAAQIDIKRDEIAGIEAKLDGFDFAQEERRISKEIVEAVEVKISGINDDIYDVEVDIGQLRRSLGEGVKFDLGKLRQVFEEAKIAIDGRLTHSYEELVEFNRKLTRERNAALKVRIAELERRLDQLIDEHSSLNQERQRLLQIIREADTFRKFKALQKELGQQRADLAYLDGQLKKMDAVAEIEREIRQLRKRRDDHVTAIEISLQRGSGIKTNVTQLFSRYVKQVLGIVGEFVITQNKGGNIEFEIKTKDVVGNDTSQLAGHTYRRLLCALFDLATLKALEDAPFYHFVYHDGIFEGLDNRMKLRLLETIREITASKRIQYILSVIEHDLPRSLDDDTLLFFHDDEVILVLHDRGDEGRLFKMPSF